MGAKAKNVPAEKRWRSQWGDIWTWTAIVTDLQVDCQLPCRQHPALVDADFMQDVASRLPIAMRPTTDSLRVYLNAARLRLRRGHRLHAINSRNSRELRDQQEAPASLYACEISSMRATTSRESRPQARGEARYVEPSEPPDADAKGALLQS